MKNQFWLRLSAVVLGGIYLASGIGKAMDINAFTDIVVQYSHEKMRFLAPLIVGVEIALGFGFLFGVFQKQFSAISISMLAFFTIFIAVSYSFGKLEDCGCFGVLLKIDPVWALFRNVFMLAISTAIFKYTTETPRMQNWLFGLSVAFGLVAFGVAAFEVKYSYVPLRLHLGDTLKTTILSKYIKPNKKQLFFIFSPTCSHCLKATENIKEYPKKGIEVIGIFSNKSAQKDIDAYRNQKMPNFEIRGVEPDSMRKLIRSVPTAFLVEGGIIQQIFISHIPTP